MRHVPSLALALLALSGGTALAHTGTGDGSGLAHGFAHPFGGVDHVLAMLAVGLLAAQGGGRALWAVPADFLGAMALGGVLGAADAGLPFLEAGIALSVVTLGAAVALGARLPVAGAAALVAAFAVFHGAAHGAEMPASASGLGYGARFLLANALLHAAGIGLVVGLERLAAARTGRALGRACGAAVALAGIALLGGAT